MNQPTASPTRKPGLFKRLASRLQRAWNAIAPGPHAWRGATVGMILAAVCFVLVTGYYAFAPAGWLTFGLGLLGLLAAAALLAGLVRLLQRFLGIFPNSYKAALVGAFFLLFLSFMALSVGALVVMAATLALSSLLGAAAWVLARGGWKTASKPQRVVIALTLGIGLAGLIGGGAWLLNDGGQVPSPANAAALAGAASNAPVAPLAADDPSQPGSYAVQTLFYGSGEDRQRPEYGAGVALVTQPVDGSKLVEGWSGLRESYWGFGPEEMPINGRVWYPLGPGPFPLVLIVHGNHFMEEYSDPGYAYLGELFASRGFILVSVDENFLNLSPAADLVLIAGLKEENDARGWLLLEHLKAWRAWNADPGNPFYQKVDMGQIALIGHSRGGEAVSVAAAFNRLPYYPDDATLAFDYNFAIRAVAAIAPVDGQYEPADRPNPLENINYLVLHGVHDMDVSAFDGARQYERLRFGDGQFWFKAALYIYGANHGQFNTVWGRKDGIEPGMRLFNLAQLMPAAEQQQIAKTYLSAFLEAALHGQIGYLPLFRDYRTARAWLPDTIYLSQYDDSTTQLVSSYEEDINVATTTLPGGSQRSENLTLWREQLLKTKWGRSANTNAAFLGWEAGAAEGTAMYEIAIPGGSLSLDASSALVFSLADANEPPTEDAKLPPAAEREPLDLTIEVVDRNGNLARLPLSSFAFLQPQIEGVVLKAAWMSAPMPNAEVVFQDFEFPLAAFAATNPAFDPAQLAAVRFVFDRTPAGVVILDDVRLRVGK